MFRKIIKFLLLCFLLTSHNIHAFNQKVVQVNGLQFWTENFGNPNDPAILLMMGYARPGLMWDQVFCEQLANRGFFVIRYDSRDTGLSSTIDYKKHPYNFLDMSKDAIAILDDYNISAAHFVAYSQGCPITLIAGAHFPKRVTSMTLISGSLDFRPCMDAIDGKQYSHKLSPSAPSYVNWVRSFTKNPPKDQKELVARLVQGEAILSGTGISFDENLHQQLALQTVVREKNNNAAINHRKATEASLDLYQQAASKVQAPTLIIQGTHDSVFPVDHGEDIKKAIPNSQLVIMQNMGHALNSAFYNDIIDHIVNLVKKTQE